MEAAGGFPDFRPPMGAGKTDQAGGSCQGQAHAVVEGKVGVGQERLSQQDAFGVHQEREGSLQHGREEQQY